MEAAGIQEVEKKKRMALKDDDWCFLAAGYITEIQRDVIFKTLLNRQHGIKGGSPPSPSAAPSLCAQTAQDPSFFYPSSPSDSKSSCSELCKDDRKLSDMFLCCFSINYSQSSIN